MADAESGFQWAWAPVATSGAAVVAALTALALGGVLTARGRLLRRLEKRVAIYDKMPESRLRTELEAGISRGVAELIVRSTDMYLRGSVLLYLSLFVATVMAFAGVQSQIRTTAGTPTSLTPSWTYFVATGVTLAFAGLAWQGNRVYLRRQVDEKLGTSTRPTVTPPGDTDQTPLTTTTDEAVPASGKADPDQLQI